MTQPSLFIPTIPATLFVPPSPLFLPPLLTKSIKSIFMVNSLFIQFWEEEFQSFWILLWWIWNLVLERLKSLLRMIQMITKWVNDII